MKEPSRLFVLAFCIGSFVRSLSLPFEPDSALHEPLMNLDLSICFKLVALFGFYKQLDLFHIMASSDSTIHCL